MYCWPERTFWLSLYDTRKICLKLLMSWFHLQNWSTWTHHALVANRKAATAWIWGPWPVAMHRTLISRLFCAHKIHRNDSKICDELFQPKAAQILEISDFIFPKPPTEQWCTNRPRNNRHTYWGNGQEEIRAPFLLFLSLYFNYSENIYGEVMGLKASIKQNGNGIRARSPTQLPYKPKDCKILLFICWASECISISPATSQTTRISSFFPCSSVLAHWSKIFASSFRPANTKQGWWWPGQMVGRWVVEWLEGWWWCCGSLLKNRDGLPMKSLATERPLEMQSRLIGLISIRGGWVTATALTIANIRVGRFSASTIAGISTSRITTIIVTGPSPSRGSNRAGSCLTCPNRASSPCTNSCH